MLKIRRFKMSDSSKIADIIRKVPMRFGQKSGFEDNRLRWKMNVSDPGAKVTKRRGYVMSAIQKKQMKKNLVVVDGDKIVGMVRKGKGNFANLYLTKKYYRRGVGAELMSTVERSCLKEIAKNRNIMKAPIAPISVIKHKYNIPVKNNFTMHQVKSSLTPLTKIRK